jgi:hypothetical protein
MPDGARILGEDGDTVSMQVSMPPDEHGFLGRQCPSCSQLFRVDADGYQALPKPLELWCVYCGHQAEHSGFLTEQQRERAMRAVGDWTMQAIGQTLERSLGGLSTPRPRSGFSVQIRYRATPFYPQPLPGIDEEKLIRVRQCAGCSLRYAVFGEHRYCPLCGALPAGVVALDAIAAETARLDGLAQLPADTTDALREQGVFNRIWVDTLENLVGAVETLASAVFHAVVPDADQRVKGKGNIFQRLDPTADLFVAAGYADLRQALGTTTWTRLLQVWATRHVFTHNDGVVDDKYLSTVPTSTARPGQRLTVTEAQTRRAIADTRELCTALTALTSTP